MHRFDESLSQYIVNHSTDVDPLLKELERETYLKIIHPQMLSGVIQGKILEMISSMIKPKNILELGTFTGYSALCLAKGLKKDGKLITIDINDELEDFTNSFFNRSCYKDKIIFKIGDACNIIPYLKEEFDLIFIDADKRQYTEYYNLVFDKVKKGGFIIADNILWYGKVNKEVSKTDLHTKELIKFNKMVNDDPRVENVIFPIRDGLMVVRKLTD